MFDVSIIQTLSQCNKKEFFRMLIFSMHQSPHLFSTYPFLPFLSLRAPAARMCFLPPETVWSLPLEFEYPSAVNQEGAFVASMLLTTDDFIVICAYLFSTGFPPLKYYCVSDLIS